MSQVSVDDLLLKISLYAERRNFLDEKKVKITFTPEEANVLFRALLSYKDVIEGKRNVRHS